ncbi:MAG: hypothetical protein M3Z33_08390 [Actinomycetota bacterium]|nr:hypothetical protein [Actinomycetota bacterium]
MTHFHTGTINVLQEDPGLARHLDHARAHLAMQRAVAGVVSLPKGFFSAHQAIPRARGTFGTLVLEGLLLRAVSVTAQPSLEVLGPGDVFQLDPVGDSYATVATLTGWWALKPARLAVLDEHFTRRMSDYPELIGELAGRLWRRSAASTLGLAIVQEPSLSVRVHFMLWHFGRPLRIRGR